MWWRPPAIGLLRQQVALAIAATATAVLFAAVVFGSRGLLHLRALDAEQDELSHRIALLLHDNEQLRDRIHRLQTDDRTLERLAREQLGFTRSGEVIYRFGSRSGSAPDARP